MPRKPRTIFPDGRQPRRNAPEGIRAAWYREQVLKLTRPALAAKLGVTKMTIGRYEGLAEVPIPYRLACAALGAELEFDWQNVKAKIGKTTVTF